MECLPFATVPSFQCAQMELDKSVLPGYPLYLPFTLCEDGEGHPMRNLRTSCSTELAVSWPEPGRVRNLQISKLPWANLIKFCHLHPLHIFEFSKIHSHLRCVQEWKDFSMLIMQTFTAQQGEFSRGNG